MTDIIERPASDSGTTMIALIVGAIAAALIGMFALGVFDRNPTADLTINTPAVSSAPADPAPASNPSN